MTQNKQEDLDILFTSVNPLRLKNNPIELDEDIIKRIYERIVLYSS